MGRLRSGQTQQTVNLSASAFGGSNPSLPTLLESIAFPKGVFFKYIDKKEGFERGGASPRASRDANS